MEHQLRDPTPDEIKSWWPMATELVKRAWFSWVVLLAVATGVGVLFTLYPGTGFSYFIVTLAFRLTITLLLFEMATLITLKSDTQFEWNEFFRNLKKIFTLRVYKAHFVYVVAIIIYSLVMAWGGLDHRGELLKDIASHNWLSFWFDACMLGPFTLIYAVFMTTGYLVDYVDYLMYLYLELDSGPRSAYKRFVQRVSQNNYGRLLLAPSLFSIGFFVVPWLGIFFIPVMFTWRYVAFRELLMSRGNSKLKEKQTVVDAVPEAA